MDNFQLNILIVEDNLSFALELEMLLENMNYTVLAHVDNSADALDVIFSKSPDLILMDIQLPEVSGLEVTKWLKEDDELGRIPVIAVTAFAMKGDEERIRQGGCEAYISKPISVLKFLETVKSYLGDA